MEQEYGFSPVCVLICFFKLLLVFINFEQNGHKYSPDTSLIGSYVFCKINGIFSVYFHEKKMQNPSRSVSVGVEVV